MNTMTQSHAGLKAKQSKEFNAFEGIFFAFSNEQFVEGMQKVGLTVNDTDKICSLGAGGYMLKSQREAFRTMIDRQEMERKEFRKDQKNLLDALVYELRNHEYCITYDASDALDALELDRDEVDQALLKKACKMALDNE